ncbi:uncharacterized PE-PGRS family protein PE_PGRS24-like [Ischnura elegans]|uniref:uncharacterized PE-PGRS family protein PE_PGRS24-like n=1 Tax=Ischnura elegans TaxID=197161 RepID=UPI001ED87C0A|nr:uncharacterized PE-PGRS family protein PE_PGRS24-like [Ischnura elegans]
MASMPIYNPPVPYVGYIDSGFGPGRMVRIQGGVSSAAQRFAINLQCGPNTNPRDDIALHLSPRFMENCVTRSSLQNQSWSGEENHGSMPLSRGQNFEIIILCDPAHFKIAINGQHFTEYVHRIPFSRVSHLAIDGDVTISLISFEGGYAPPPVAGNGVPGFAPVPPMPSPGMMPGAAPGAAPYPSQPGMPYGQPGPVPGYGPPPMYGGGGYAPPGPQPYAPYGGYGGYGHGQPPPPPGYQAPKSGGGMLDKAGMALAGALGGAGIMGAVGGKYPTLPQGHGDIGQQSGGGSGTLGGLGTLGTLIGTGIAGAALSGVLGGKDTPSTTSSNNPTPKPKVTDTHPSGGGSNPGAAGGLGYLGSFISPGLAGAIQQSLMGPDRNAATDKKYPNPPPQGGDPSAGSAGGLGSLGSLIGTGLAGAIQSGLIGGQNPQQPNPYDRRSPNPYGYGGQGPYGGQSPYPGHNPYGGQGGYGGGAQGGGSGGLESLGGLIGSGLAGAIGSRLFSGGTGGKEQSNRATNLYSSKDEEKPVHKSGGKIDENLIRCLDELIVSPEDKKLNKNVISMVDAEAPARSSHVDQEKSEAKREEVKEEDSAKKPEETAELTADDILAQFAEKPIVKPKSEIATKPGKRVEEPIEEIVLKPANASE